MTNLVLVGVLIGCKAKDHRSMDVQADAISRLQDLGAKSDKITRERYNHCSSDGPIVRA